MESGTLELVIIATGFEVPDRIRRCRMGGWSVTDEGACFCVSENPERPEIPEKGGEEPVMAGDGETLQGVWGELSRKVSGWVGGF